MQLSEDLLSQAVMMVENSRPTLAINLSGARQYWLEGMLRHEIGQHVEHVEHVGGGLIGHKSQGWKQVGILISVPLPALLRLFLLLPLAPSNVLF